MKRAGLPFGKVLEELEELSFLPAVVGGTKLKNSGVPNPLGDALVMGAVGSTSPLRIPSNLDRLIRGEEHPMASATASYNSRLPSAVDLGVGTGLVGAGGVGVHHVLNQEDE